MRFLFLKRKFRHKNTHRGFGLIEIVIGAAILSTSLLGISFYFQEALNVSERTGNIVRAAFLMEEGIEITRFFRDNGWANISGLAAGTPYYLTWNGTTWATTTTNTFIDGLYERKVVATDVYRDSNDDIVSSGGTLDSGTREITVSVAWQEKGATTTKTVSTYLANFFN
jgi:Tfp pilus assembly protein PilV